MTVIACQDPGELVNGRIDGVPQDKVFIRGTTLTFSCSTGFALSGNEQMTCVTSSGGADWNGNVPSCQGTWVHTYTNTHTHIHPIVQDSTFIRACIASILVLRKGLRNEGG